jgi:hypothetical protein
MHQERHEHVLRLANEGMERFEKQQGMFAFFSGAGRANLSETRAAARLFDKALEDPVFGTLAAYYRGLLAQSGGISSTRTGRRPFSGPIFPTGSRWIF